jgi:hypothetical protein
MVLDRNAFVNCVASIRGQAVRSHTTPAALKVVESVTSIKGGTYLRLTRAGKPEYGTIGAG